MPAPLPVEQGAELLKKTEELELHVRTKEDLVSKMREEMDPLIQTANKNLQIVDSIYEVITFTASGFMIQYVESLLNFFQKVFNMFIARVCKVCHGFIAKVVLSYHLRGDASIYLSKSFDTSFIPRNSLQPLLLLVLHWLT